MCPLNSFIGTLHFRHVTCTPASHRSPPPLSGRSRSGCLPSPPAFRASPARRKCGARERWRAALPSARRRARSPKAAATLVSFQVLPTTTQVGLSPTCDLRRWGALRNPSQSRKELTAPGQRRLSLIGHGAHVRRQVLLQRDAERPLADLRLVGLRVLGNFAVPLRNGRHAKPLASARCLRLGNLTLGDDNFARRDDGQGPASVVAHILHRYLHGLRRIPEACTRPPCWASPSLDLPPDAAPCQSEVHFPLRGAVAARYRHISLARRAGRQRCDSSNSRAVGRIHHSPLSSRWASSPRGR